MKRRFIRAVAAAAAVVPAIMVVSRLVQNIASQRVRSYADDPIMIVAGAVIIGFPLAVVAVLSTIVPLTRYCVRRGYTNLGIMAAAGAIIGAILLPAVVALSATLPSNFPTLLALIALVGGIAGGGTIAAYWLALDPPSYYRQS